MNAAHESEALRAVESSAPPPGARERVWARLHGEPRRRPRRVRLVAAGVALVLVSALAAALLGSRRPPAHTPARAVAVEWSDGSSADARGWITTKGREALLGDGSTWLAKAHRGTTLRVRSPAGRTRLELSGGALDVWAAPRGQHGALEVAAGRHCVRVVGTLFAVRRVGGGAAVWVAHGTVEILRKRRVVATLRDGGWSTGDLSLPRLSGSAARWLEERAAGRAPARRQPWLSAERPPADPSVDLSAAPPSAAPDPVAEESAAPQPQSAVFLRLPRREPAPLALGAAVESAASDAAQGVLAPEVEPEAAPPTPAVTEDDSATRLAMRLEREGRLEESVALYRRIAAGSGADAEFALYRCGHVLEEQRGDARGALTLWRQQRVRFPAGTLRHEADLSILDVLVRLGRHREAASEADAFLARWPASDRRRDVETIRERLSHRE